MKEKPGYARMLSLVYPGSSGFRFRDGTLLLIYIWNQSPCRNNLLHKRRECLALIGLSRRLIRNDAAVKIDFHLVTRSDGLSSLRAFDDRQADVDSVAVKNSCKSLRYDTADPRALDYERRMLSGGAAAKILIRYDNIAFFYIFHKMQDYRIISG